MDPTPATITARAATRVGSSLRKRSNWEQLAKFCIVGTSGYVVNLAAYAILLEVAGFHYMAAAVGSFLVAVANNYTWNRLWTWHDRREHIRTPVVVQFLQYGVACWIGIVLQFVITKLLVAHVHYLLANLVAIVIASLVNFVVNDNWTFGRLRLLLRRARHHAHAHDKPPETPPR